MCERTCRNCKHWQVNLQFKGDFNGETCRLGKGRTMPNDTCSRFTPKSTFDSLQDPYKYIDEYRNGRILK
ncbi:hypothetical protein [uncultured Methanobrevibacter sp.]|uniref:hypothetical protein n=1 Tax=uncultured Methanobrevibacter sp. TaxID=253161 RepID=UPI0025F22922|nr:hypothetical protein [uncultured Methanobrevibacter sp.]MDO5809706.1 hypothetical protein [Methanobrevibacter sp.]